MRRGGRGHTGAELGRSRRAFGAAWLVCLGTGGGSTQGGAAAHRLRPAGPASANVSPNAHPLCVLKTSCCTRYEGRRLRRLSVMATAGPFAAQRALTLNAKGVVLHTLRASQVAPVVGQSHNRRISQPLFRASQIVDQSHNRRLNTIYFELRRLWSVRK